MERKIIMAGKLNPQLQKPNNIEKIIGQINSVPINKNQKYILFIAAIRIIEDKKQNAQLIRQLEEMQKEKQIIKKFSKSKYIFNIIKYLENMNQNDYKQEIETLINYVKTNNIEL